ncbi:hypothetical protein Psi02_21180 [Planotetraspora silvatica]|uniref:BioF2-like acetyltransferase domain-containing protein n=1 Tax=Planotetraspora silvatica TaxID=234614 RepID=A0A8J3XLK7_9ACTN|nr:GNAT family N-acetyltransferase [Planotetraspora silvatica]GII45694.1 hypothetical protein Psi02_21180 [Planotetraspora silvatica]
MNITVVRPGELGDAEIAAWRALQRADLLLDNPFLSPDFALAVDRYRDNVHVAVISSATGVVGVFPFQRQALGVGLPVGAGFNDAQGLVGAADLRVDAGELLRACGLAVWEFDHLLAGQFTEFHTERQRSPIIDLGGGFDDYVALIRSRSTSTYKTVAYRERKLGRDVGQIRHVFDSRDPGDLRALLSWKSAQYRETGQRDLFADPRFTELVERLHQEPGEGVRGALSMLYAGDQPIAGHFGLVSETVLCQWFPAYDKEFGRYSPGLVQHLGMAREAAERGVRHIHLGKSQATYKDFLANTETQVAEGRVSRPSVGATLHWAKSVPAGRIKDTLRKSDALRSGVRRARILRGRLSGGEK